MPTNLLDGMARAEMKRIDQAVSKTTPFQTSLNRYYHRIINEIEMLQDFIVDHWRESPAGDYNETFDSDTSEIVDEIIQKQEDYILNNFEANSQAHAALISFLISRPFRYSLFGKVSDAETDYRRGE